jgi:hypothetical protein
MKTVRFTQVVERSGQPAVHAFWVAPEKDREFQRALKTHRVLTVAAIGKGKADAGHVGFENYTPGAQVLIFPKSLRPFEGAKIVGVKFDMVSQPETVAAKPADVFADRTRRHRARPSSHLRGDPPRRDSGEPPQVVAKDRRDASKPADAPPVLSDQTRAAAAARPPAAKRIRQARQRAAEAPSADLLVREIKAALKELKAGKAVAAYERLARAIESDPASR